MTNQNNYREWFWSHLPAEGLNSDLDILDEPQPALEKPTNPAAHPTNLLDQVKGYLHEIEDIVAQTRQEEQERQLELIRSIASMYILQGDIKGAEVCRKIENILLTNDTP